MNQKGLNVLVYTIYDPSLMERIRERFPHVIVHVVTDDGRFMDALPDADVVYLQRDFAFKLSEKMAPVIAASNRLRWIHWGYTGLDSLRGFESQWNKVLLTNSRGILAETIADYVILAIQLLHRQFLRVMRNQMNKIWERWLFDNPRGKTLGIIGLGSIGKQVARKAKLFGMRPIGLVRRNVPVNDVDDLFLPTEFWAFLAESDIVAICAPLTPQTRGLIGEEALGWMRPKSYLINIARGQIVDEGALIRALKSGHLAGAALDAFAKEPLAPDNELWSLDNVIITPHLSGQSRDFPDRALALFCGNLEKFLAGKPLINPVETGNKD